MINHCKTQRIETNKETYLEAEMFFVVLAALSKETIENIAVIGW